MLLDGKLMPVYHEGYQEITIPHLIEIIGHDDNGSVCDHRNGAGKVSFAFECNDNSEFCNNCALSIEHRAATINAIKKLTIEKLRNVK